ncbi:MAG: cyclic nucleotide-binding domain-containing protein [Rhodospirillales bacterium]|nr:cyclic nucleotide-binding domain-containing protein [Rhodospirillales bacterium]
MRSYIILDMRRVQSVDVTAAHVLELIEDALKERGGSLIFSHLPLMQSGRDLEDDFGQVGLVKPGHQSRVFGELDEALEWVENRILEDSKIGRTEETLLGLRDIDIFKKRRDETLAELEAAMETRSVKAGERLFALGDSSDELYLVRRGAIRIMQPLKRKQGHHLATFNRGDFFGEMAFLDREPRSADAYAERDTELFVLSRAAFDDFAANHKKTAIALLEGLARTLSLRLRFTNAELRQLEDD